MLKDFAQKNKQTNLEILSFSVIERIFHQLSGSECSGEGSGVSKWSCHSADPGSDQEVSARAHGNVEQQLSRIMVQIKLSMLQELVLCRYSSLICHFSNPLKTTWQVTLCFAFVPVSSTGKDKLQTFTSASIFISKAAIR